MAVASVVLFAVTLTQRQPLPLVVFSAVLLVIALGDDGYFMSRARFLMPAFPLLFPLAVALARVRNRATLAVLVGGGTLVSALLGGYLVLVWTAFL